MSSWVHFPSAWIRVHVNPLGISSQTKKTSNTSRLPMRQNHQHPTMTAQEKAQYVCDSKLNNLLPNSSKPKPAGYKGRCTLYPAGFMTKMQDGLYEGFEENGPIKLYCVFECLVPNGHTVMGSVGSCGLGKRGVSLGCGFWGGSLSASCLQIWV